MAPPPPFGANSAAARDIANVLHPYTDLQTHQQVGPMVVTRGKGVRVWDDTGKDYIESVAGLWCASLGFDNERLVQAAVAQMRKLPFYHAFTAKSHEPLIDLSEMLIQRAPVPMSKVFFANSGSEANDSAIKMIWYFNNAVGRPDKKKIIGRLKGYHGITLASASLTGIPHNHRAFDLPLPGFMHTMSAAPLPRRQSRRERGGVRLALRGRAGEADPRRRAGHGGGDVGRTDHGRRRRDRAAADVFRKDPGGAAQVRRAVRRRRGDLRLLAHRQLLGQPDAEHAAGHPDLRQGAVLVVPADQRGDGERARVPGAGEAEPRDRHVRSRLHLFRPSGAGGGGDRDAEDLRRDEHRRACPHRRRAHAGGTAAALRRASAGGRGARRRPDRRRSNWWPTRRSTRTSNPPRGSAGGSPS